MSWRPHPQGHNAKGQPRLTTTENRSCQHGKWPDSTGNHLTTAVSPQQTLRTGPGQNGQLCNTGGKLCPTDAQGPTWRRHGVDLPPGYTAAPLLSVYTLCVLSPMVLDVNAVSAKSSRPRGCRPRPMQTGYKLSGEPATVQSRRQLCSKALGATHPSSNLCPWASSVAIAASVSSFVTRG